MECEISIFGIDWREPIAPAQEMHQRCVLKSWMCVFWSASLDLWGQGLPSWELLNVYTIK